ncbi:MAG: branched-chain alpha-keto acid dehydrogenase subunit E2 [Spirochaeta sp. LUC14_002_19_P3]|nr:MAG: branched-chain alpha-keto acid dehydrogenase subunit E2 [Spirochaeta sp. LUC14_002_19_P3]
MKVPNLDGAKDVAVVEVYISAGDSVEPETPLISLESDKAVMDVPSPLAGTITELKVKEGDKVNSGDVIALAEGAAGAEPPPKKEVKKEPAPQAVPAEDHPKKTPEPAQAMANSAAPVNAQPLGAASHATPSVRGLARELGIDLSQLSGSGPKGRVLREDLTSLVKSLMSGGVPASGTGFNLPPIPGGDYANFGTVEEIALSRIRKISGPHLHRNWLGIPHVTQFEEADITALEEFRQSLNKESAKSGAAKVSPLIFILKAVVHALKEFPDFNSSLNPDGASLTRKHYYNIGIAVDTPGGLVVPVIRNADTKGIRELAAELAGLSTRAREGKLKPDEMKGGTFTISNLGGIGGTYFTPIVNAPEAAILGLSKSAMKPVWDGSQFVPRLILPLSVSYDHRVIDGAQGARFTACLASVIGDIRRMLL